LTQNNTIITEMKLKINSL